MSGLTFRVAGQDVRFGKALPILVRSTRIPSSVFDGAFGLDLLNGRQELTLNYEAMRISLR